MDFFKIGRQQPLKWQLQEGQHIEDLQGEKVFRYPVESGMGCFMDRNLGCLNHLENRLFHRKADTWGFTKNFPWSFL